ncbi:MAG: SusC/RagA family TonB-linked outer membrane protein [Bacteroidetes bacterium]|jgi:TonB-linked SusC/RagA family outer membrane protein|nr:SusC/RagA family TonB-linked outer membrane protein [Bacteroidota bacterium]
MRREKLLLISLLAIAFAMVPNTAWAQTGEISGVVADSLTGEALPGVNVVVVGTQQGAATDVSGNYTISGVSPGIYDVQATFIGYEPKMVEDVEVLAGETAQVDFMMAEGAFQLEEVVAVGYGTQQRQDVTGSVSSVDVESIQGMPLTSPDQALQGRIAGVSVQSSTGIPGGGPAIQVRGTANVGAGGQPLYVIDGFALPQPSQGQVTRRNPLADIPPEDIESISVLKDASATAIYGSRASNGVVIINTKSGRSGAFEFNVSASTSTSQVMEDINEPATARQFVDFQNFIWEERVRNGEASEVPAEYQNPDQYGAGTNWFDAIYNTAQRYNVNMSASGGTDQLRSFFSLGFTSEEGLLENNDYTRISARANLDANLTERLALGLNLAPTFSERNLNWGGNGRGGPGGAPWMLCPIPPVRDDDGSFHTQPGQECTGVWSHPNPVKWLQQQVDEERTLRTLASAFADYQLMDGLSARTSFNVDFRTGERDQFRPSSLGFINSPPPVTPTGAFNTDGYLNWLSETTLNWQSELGPGSIDAIGGFTIQQQTEGGSRFTGQFPGDEIRTLNVASQIDGLTDEAEWSLMSGLGRVNYNLFGRYVFTGTIRADGSSRFGQDNRWGTFPSGAVAWNLHNESFMEELSDGAIPELRLRASYGLTGNNQIGNYASLGVVGSSDYVFGGSAAAGRVLNTMGNSALSWEKTREVNVGLDAVLYDFLLELSVDVYQRNTTQLLIDRELPMTAGFGGVTENTGELRNRGLEVALNATNVNRENFRWNTDVTFALNRNEIVSLPGGEDVRYSAWPARYIHREGIPMSSYVGHIVDGLYESQEQIDNMASLAGSVPGTMIFRDINQDGLITPNTMAPDGDFVVIGDAYPDFTFGIGNTMAIGPLTLRAQITGAFGGDNLRTEWITTSRNIDGLFNVDAAYVENFWRSPEQPGDGLTPTPIGGAAPRQHYRDWMHTMFMDDASHIWLRDAMVRYDFSSGAFAGTGIYVSGSNLFLLTPYPGNPDATNLNDPSNNPGMDDGNYPLPRTVTFGIDVSF